MTTDSLLPLYFIFSTRENTPNSRKVLSSPNPPKRLRTRGGGKGSVEGKVN